MRNKKRMYDIINNISKELKILKKELEYSPIQDKQQFIMDLLPLNFEVAQQKRVAKFAFIKTLIERPEWEYGYNKTIEIVNNLIKDGGIKTKKAGYMIYVFREDYKEMSDGWDE